MSYEDIDVFQPEGQFFDRKSLKAKPIDLIPCVIAFANAKGGIIVVGVDNEELEDFSDVDNIKRNDFLQIIFEQTFPTVKFNYEFIWVADEDGEKHEVLILEVFSSNFVHIRENGDCFIRIGDESKKLNYENRLRLEFEKGTIFFENIRVQNFEQSNFDIEVLKKYRTLRKLDCVDYNKFLLNNKLAKSKLNKIEYTMAAVLLFGKNPEEFISNSFIQVDEYNGKYKKLGKLSTKMLSRSFKGPLVKQIEFAMNYLQDRLNNAEYNLEVIREVLVNAILHRAYNKIGDSIRVEIFEHQIKVVSPGTLPGFLNKHNIAEESYTRNPKIVEVMNNLGYGSKQNLGIDKIYSISKDEGFPEPQFIESTISFTVIIDRRVQ